MFFSLWFIVFYILYKAKHMTKYCLFNAKPTIHTVKLRPVERGAGTEIRSFKNKNKNELETKNGSPFIYSSMQNWKQKR